MLDFIVRITPTCVGNTPYASFSIFSVWDHPHLCGEHYGPKLMSGTSMGSPPPVWGTLNVFKLKFHAGRITPTCVGNTAFINRSLF